MFTVPCTTQNTVISPNFLAGKFRVKAEFPQSFHKISTLGVLRTPSYALD